MDQGERDILSKRLRVIGSHLINVAKSVGDGDMDHLEGEISLIITQEPQEVYWGGECEEVESVKTSSIELNSNIVVGVK